MRPSGLVILLAVGVSVCALPAQGPTRVGRVRGVVVDSLLSATLPGATVRLAKLGLATHSDSTGRFIFDSVPPGEWEVTFRHPELDSLGFAESGALVRVFAGATATLTLATRSFDAYRTRFCAETPDSLSSTVAFGGVHALDGSRVRVDVSVVWISPQAPDGNVRNGTVRTIADGEGRLWIACGIPPRSWILASVRDSVRVASAIVEIGARGLAVRDLVLSGGTMRMAGLVRDAEGHAVDGAHVSVVDSDLASESDASGTFVLANAPSGTFTLGVRAAGYRPWIGALEGGPDRIDVKLQPLVTDEPLEPRGSDYLRLLQRIDRKGMAVFAGPEFATDTTTIETRIAPGTCHYWLDGRPVERAFFVAQPRWSWRALELYARGADAPPEYRSLTCGVALLWTAAADW